jgi:hypothetical protein
LLLPPIATPHSCNAVQFSPDGRRLATACSAEGGLGAVQIWDVATGRPLTGPIGHTGSVSAVAFSPDGRRLLTAGSDATACLWDATSGALVLPPMRHHFPVGSATFSRDGHWISTLCNPMGAVWAREFSSSYAQVWDAATGLPVTPPLRSEKEITGAVLSADGRRVATASYSQSTQLRSLEPDRRSFDDLLGLTQILSGTRLDASGVAVPLQTTEFRTAYEDFSRPAPDSFTASRAQILGWHHQQFLHCNAAERWEAALVHLDRVIALGPDYDAPHAIRFAIHLNLDHWRDVLRDLEAVIALSGQDPRDYADSRALLCLGCDDRTGYRAACTELLNRFGASEDIWPAGLAAWSCVLAEGVGADLEAVLALARRVAAWEPKEAHWGQTVGAALYRAGQFDEAIEQLIAADRLPDQGRTSPAYRRYFLAMAHHRLGHDTEARRWMTEANAQAQRELKGLADGTGKPPPWNRRLTLQHLRRQAESLLGAPPQPPSDTKRPQPPNLDAGSNGKRHRDPIE